MKHTVKCISGPTGSGKTALALDVRRSFTSLVSADAFQFYREIPILGAQPPSDQRHHFQFVSDRSLCAPLSAGEFARLSSSFLQPEYLWVGTGLYLGAALYGLDQPGVKGTPFQRPAKINIRMVVLDPPRAELYDLLNSRVDQMLDAGALREAQIIFEKLSAGELSSTNPVLKAIGLKHLLTALRGDATLARTTEEWKRDTRRLAKRQWTWLRKFCPPSPTVFWTGVLSEAREFLSLPSSS